MEKETETMIRHMAADPKRGALEFARFVQKHFQFLVEHYGFTCVSAQPTFVRYESQDMFVNLYHGRSSFEFGLEFGALHDPFNTSNAPLTLRELLRVLGQSDKLHYVAGTTREVVDAALAERAEKLRAYGDRLLRGDPRLLEDLRRNRRDEKKRYGAEVRLSQIREQAEEAWRAKDLVTVASLYGSMERDLTDVEAKRLQYAKKRMGSSPSIGP